MIPAPVVMETHGGNGVLFNYCYAHLETGVVFEKSPEKAARLGRQRPTWAVYETDCIMALAGGVGGHLPVNLLDCDPYGSPWEVIEAFFNSDRPRPDYMVVVINDGLRQKIRMGGAWQVECLRGVVAKYGNDIHSIYLEICMELMEEKAMLSGYKISQFSGYYCGHLKQMSHYFAVLNK